MPLKFIKRDITKVTADIIVNPSDGNNFNENNISKAIAEIAGKEYSDMISKMSSIATGNAILMEAYDLVYKYVAHVALPDWYGGTKNEREYLDSCYSEVLYLADEKKCKTIVFPILGVGLYGIPYKESLNIGVRAIEAYLTVKDSLNVFITTKDEKICAYIKQHFPQYYIEEEKIETLDSINSLDYQLSHLDYKFIDSLLHYMKRMELNSVQCYTAAGVDKKLFSKIKNNPKYLPSKSTIIKFAFALHLSLKETQQLLGTCGYILSDSLKEDIVVKYYLSQRIYEYSKMQEEINKRSL